jgi:hypothetical protein
MDYDMNIDLISDSEFHNIVSGQDGLATRPGFLTTLRVEDLGVATPRAADGTAQQIISGFTVESANTGAIYHYIFAIDGYATATQYLYDVEMQCLGAFEIGRISSQDPFSYAVNYNQIIVNSPGLPFPLWGFIGGTLVRAQTVPSMNPDTQALTLFPGLVCSFADRFVWAYKNQIIVNDPGLEPRTITAPNSVSFGGQVLDMFQSGSGGNLVIVCTDAVYQIPPDALTGYQLQSVVGKITGYQGVGRLNAATARGTVAGLVRGGMINIGDMSVTELTKYRRRRRLTAPVGPGVAGDYRTGYIFGADEGYYINCANRICMVDLDGQVVSWIYPSGEDLGEPYSGDQVFNLVGLLKNSDGRTIFLTSTAAIDMWGNIDLGQTPTVAEPDLTEATPSGALCKMVPAMPEDSPVLREITAGSDRAGFEIGSYCRGSLSSVSVPAPQGSVIIGTTEWGATFRLVEKEMRSRRMQRAVRGDAPDMEIRWTGGRVGIYPVAEIVFKGWGNRRPTY